jgi:hypothetical protein
MTVDELLPEQFELPPVPGETSDAS